MGFSSMLCGQILEMLRSVGASVILKGCPTQEFHIQRGLRQGDPLFPFIFILVMEGLHVALVRAQLANVYRGIFVSGIKIPHLLYVYDIVLLSPWDSKIAMHIVRILYCLFLFSSLKINFHKSKLFGIGYPTSYVVLVVKRMRCTSNSLPFSHLGVPFGQNISQVNACSSIHDKLWSRLAC